MLRTILLRSMVLKVILVKNPQHQISFFSVFFRRFYNVEGKLYTQNERFFLRLLAY